MYKLSLCIICHIQLYHYHRYVESNKKCKNIFSASFSFVPNSFFAANVLVSIYLIILLHFSLMRFRWASSIFSLTFFSSIVLFILKQYDSGLFLGAILSFYFSLSAWYLSASLTIRSISPLLRRPLSLVIVILFSLFIDFFVAETISWHRCQM